jgi:hypothetical protein
MCSIFFAAIEGDTVPAVAYVKPEGFLDGHPQSSKLDLFEAFVQNIVDKVKAKPEPFAETAIVVTFDEGGGYDDSGFIQPVDFFGDGPRIPAIVISPFSTGGRVVLLRPPLGGEVHRAELAARAADQPQSRQSSQPPDRRPQCQCADQQAGHRRPLRHVRFRRGSRRPRA